MALKPIVDSVRYGQLDAIRENIRRVETKSGADSLVSDAVTWVETMFFKGLDKVNLRRDNLLCNPPSHPTPSSNPPNPEGASTSIIALAHTDSEVCGDGPMMAGNLGSGRAPSARHPLYPMSCDFMYIR